MTIGRWVAVVILILAGVFAWNGGIFTTAGYREVERQLAEDSVKLRSLQREVATKRAYKDSLEHSPVVQERVAREQWGMIRDGELSFQIIVKPAVPADTGRH